MTYKEALEKLEKIAAEVQNPEISLSDIDAKIKEADGLIEFCRSYLRSAREQVVK